MYLACDVARQIRHYKDNGQNLLSKYRVQRQSVRFLLIVFRRTAIIEQGIATARSWNRGTGVFRGDGTAMWPPSVDASFFFRRARRVWS
ncbi:unnamed protein product [Angiostrongylus costaricensis]|uniref:Transposase n=1 Tax=Angiostrongylus costaricensis TaxID=334426 RepID=A0A0R3PCV2_ANGCS|nr:unnamed protein product [Angiostrongylus costaricensis]